MGDEFNAAIVSGGANGGWGIAFEERDNALDTTSTLRTNFMGPGTLTGVEQSVLEEDDTVNQHDAALSGSFLDRTLVNPVGGSALPKDMSDGYNVAWVSTDLSTPPDRCALRPHHAAALRGTVRRARQSDGAGRRRHRWHCRPRQRFWYG